MRYLLDTPPPSLVVNVNILLDTPPQRENTSLQLLADGAGASPKGERVRYILVIRPIPVWTDTSTGTLSIVSREDPLDLQNLLTGIRRVPRGDPMIFKNIN